LSLSLACLSAALLSHSVTLSGQLEVETAAQPSGFRRN